jgi:hypothetical protein
MFSIYGFSQFNHILHQQTLNYNIIDLKIQPLPLYSHCIQQYEDTIYIPHASGKFIELKN